MIPPMTVPTGARGGASPAYARGIDDYKAGRHADAVAAFAEALAADPRNHRALVFQGLSHVALGNLDDARRALEAAVEIAPDYGKAHNALGNVLRRLGEMDLALDAFRAAARLDPRSAEPSYNLGITHLDLAQIPEAIDAFRAAAAVAPRDADIACDLAAAYTRYKAWGDAVRTLEDFLAGNPDDDRAIEMRARLKKLKERHAQETAARQGDGPPVPGE